MTVDLTTAREGDVVEFRCGGRVKITESYNGRHIMFEGNVCLSYLQSGHHVIGANDPFDIIAIHPRAMTPEERLAKIVDIAARWRTLPSMLEILKLARGEP